MPVTDSTSSNSGGVLQSLGIGSGLDISTLVTELTTAEMSAPNARITRAQTSVTTQVSAMATLKSALSTFQSSLSKLLSGSGFSARNVSSGDDSVMTATATSSAALGNYQVQVQQLAQSQQLLSGNFASGASTVIGTGTLSLGSDGNNFSVTIDSSNSTLAGIRDAINSASDNQSVSATLVYGQSGAQLVLSSLKTGADAAMTIESTGGDGGLAQLTYGTDNIGNYTQQQSAQDAIVFVSGVERHSSTNQVADAIDGVTLSLVDSDPGTNIALKITNDSEHVVSLVQSFVTAYNTLQTSVKSLDAYDSSTGEKGALFGDSMYASLKAQIRRAVTDSVAAVTGPYNSLAALGLTHSIDGVLSADETKLRAALTADFKAVSHVFSGANGVVARINKNITTALLTGGAVATRKATLTTRQTAIDSEKSLIELRTAKVKERYLLKFNAMDSLLAQLQSTSTYLSQQLDALNRASNS
ncbi:MAG: flagellar filament capping protein FliD [Steroidobacteraceae bacterium]